MKKVLFSLSILLICQLAKSQYSQNIIIEPLLKTDTTSIGQKIVYPDFQDDEVTILKITIPRGESTGWHKHSFPVFAYVVQGILTIDFENNTSKQFSTHSSFAEVVNTYHNGINKGDEDVILIAFFMGEKGKSLSIHKE
jgi:quercetin dioxygenase-like cupin family protein